LHCFPILGTYHRLESWASGDESPIPPSPSAHLGLGAAGWYCCGIIRDPVHLCAVEGRVTTPHCNMRITTPWMDSVIQLRRSAMLAARHFSKFAREAMDWELVL
jgi:hypothetical protein